MQTTLADFVKTSPHHDEMASILRSCVHCGFCNATCPTYQLTGDELDSPRGRIYLLKQMLEGQEVSQLSQYHLDRCLSCRACETTCPSGVRYERLLDLGRVIVDEKVPRPLINKLKRQLIAWVFTSQQRFSLLLRLIRPIKPLLPQQFKQKIPDYQPLKVEINTTHSRKMLLLTGCVQNVLAPEIDQATTRVLNKLQISLISVNSSGCCGALNYHLSEHQKALQLVRNNIDACEPYLEAGAEAIISTASGCGVMLKDYGLLLKDDANYREKAARFSSLVKDISEVITVEDLSVFQQVDNVKLAFQAPCTLQHGQRLSGVVENILQRLGYKIMTIENGHLCCGSAGVYSLMQTELATQLRDNKLKALQADNPDCIVSANIGCLNHLQANSTQKLRHWIELLI
ncbi:MAG: glycolate oxidase subunit GlcF [Methylococcaceae bacterium]|nr:glycolate oxidase subunit GlcF [Methylococcaceae bacterium]